MNLFYAFFFFFLLFEDKLFFTDLLHRVWVHVSQFQDFLKLPGSERVPTRTGIRVRGQVLWRKVGRRERLDSQRFVSLETRLPKRRIWLWGPIREQVSVSLNFGHPLFLVFKVNTWVNFHLNDWNRLSMNLLLYLRTFRILLFSSNIWYRNIWWVHLWRVFICLNKVNLINFGTRQYWKDIVNCWLTSKRLQQTSLKWVLQFTAMLARWCCQSSVLEMMLFNLLTCDLKSWR